MPDRAQASDRQRPAGMEEGANPSDNPRCWKPFRTPGGGLNPISESSVAGLIALGHLATFPAGRFTTLAALHRHCGVPRTHLVRVLRKLVRSGILLSSRGPTGGFALSGPPDQITARRVVQAIEGSHRRAGCLLLQEPCRDDVVCPLNHIWRNVFGLVLTQLDTTSVADLADELAYREDTRCRLLAGAPPAEAERTREPFSEV